MSEYIVSARKYRPMTFDSVVGQPALTQTLKNAVKTHKLAHAYLFCGPRGVGKTTCARIFAKAINCMNPTADGEACNECESCKAFNEQRSFNIFELDAASNNSVENIKQLMEQTRIPPQMGKYKVFIIDEVHMLSPAAFNAFLKTLEEPPAHVIFILATTEKHKILPTILSRCQIFDFERMTVPLIIKHLKYVAEKENIGYDEQALNVIAEKADGGMRDALSIFDQAASFCQGNITYEKVLQDLNILDSENYFQTLDYAYDNKVTDIMLLLNNVIARGFDAAQFVNGLASHVRNVLMAKDAQTLPLIETSDQQRQRYAEQAKKCSTPFLYKALQILNRCDVEYKQSSNKRLLVELTLIEIGQITQPDEPAADAGAGRWPHRLKSLFKKISQSRPVPQVTGTRKRPAAAVKPKVEPVVQPAKAEVPKPTVKLSNIGFTFKSLNQPKVKPAYMQEAEEVKQSNESNSFTQEELDYCWMQMCNRMPETKIGLSRRLKNLRPVITQYPNLELTVDNSILLEQLQTIEKRIKATLMRDLHNADLQFTVRLAQPTERTKLLTQQELFANVCKENASIELLCKDLGLELN